MVARLLTVAFLCVATLALPTRAAQLAPLPRVISPRLYVIDCGTLKRMPDEERTACTVESRQKVEELVARTGAQLWIGHSMEFFRTVRKSPAWYD
jgi:hypothetical protein